MLIDETVYREYANWKLENEVFIKDLKENAENIYFRFNHIIDVIEFFYDKLIDDPSYTSEDDVIFKTGFYYVADQLEEFKVLLKDNYNNKIENAKDFSREINLYFNTLDFQTEIINYDFQVDEDIKSLMDFDKKVLKFITGKEHAPDELFEELDALTNKIYQKLETNFYSINNIFLEIADELDIL